jgi:3-hydroxybutyrate dehydrogenase
LSFGLISITLDIEFLGMKGLDPLPLQADLGGKHALVTGASRGIGAAIAARLAASGAAVTLLGRDQTALETVKASIGGSCHVAVCDLADPDQIHQSFGHATAALGPLSILVNNAGIAPSAPFGKVTLADWQKVLAVDLTAAFLTAQAVLPGMRAAQWGRIVNIASTAGLTGYRYVAPYVAAKHGLIGLTRALALETATLGITVNAVCPGFADTEIVAQAVATIAQKSGRSAEDAKADLVRSNPQGRLIDPQEVADMVAYLCSEAARSITGQALTIDGGEVMK